MAHPYASQAKASQKRRLSALGAKAGKSFGSSSMYKKTSYPGKGAGSSTPMTISGGSSRKRADQPAKFASGGSVSGAPKAKPKGHSTTNIIIANGGRSGKRGNRGGGLRPPPPAIAVPKPVPVPVPVGGAGGPPPGAGAGPLPPPGLMGAPSGPPPGLPAGPPPRMGPPGMASGGLAGSSYHDWGEGYKDGGAIKKASGGAIEKKAMGGKMLRGGNKPGSFKPGAIPGQPVVPLSGKPTPMVGGLGMKKGGKTKKYAGGGSIKKYADGEEVEPSEGDSDKDDSSFNLSKVQKGIRGLQNAVDPNTGATGQARASEDLGLKTMAQNDASMRKLGAAGKPQSGGFKGGALPYSSSGFKKGGKVSSHDDAAQDKKLIKSMIAKEEKKEKYADGGFVPKNEKSKDSALIGSTYRNQGTGFNRGGVVKKAGSHSGLGRLQKIAGAKAVPAKTEL